MVDECFCWVRIGCAVNNFHHWRKDHGLLSLDDMFDNNDEDAVTV